ncbi:protein kinase, partial [Streptomyces boluensis]
MDEYAGRVLADRYRLPLPPSDEYEFAESRAFDTYSGQEVLVRQVPLPETVDAEVLDEDTGPYGTGATAYGSSGRSTRTPADPAVRRAIEAAQAAAQIPDHPRLDQVFDVFAEDGSLWIVSEVVAALPLAALIADRPLSPYRAAEIASDVLTALRVLHAHGWVHRNITMRTVLVCDDGRVLLTGLAAGAAEEALCGYDPVPETVSETVSDAVQDLGEEPHPDEEPRPDEDPDVPQAEASGPPGRIVDPYGVAGQSLVKKGKGGPGVPAQKVSTWDELVAAAEPGVPGSGDGRKGPATPLAAERARQARMNVVGAVTERWAPEQAGPVHENWQLAAPVGPATDLWALGALLFRAVQGHAPYPEDSPYELVQLVCAEPPAFAEECGPLRPVVESLLRQDPTERPDFEELRGWLRSLVRSAPEPEAGLNVVPSPPFDRTKLPVVRRRGELVRRRRAGRSARSGRHKRGRAAQAAYLERGAEPTALDPRSAGAPRVERAPEPERVPRQSRAPRPSRPPKASRAPREQEAPRRLGRVLLVVILLGLVAAVAYAVLFLPKAGEDGAEGAGD